MLSIFYGNDDVEGAEITKVDVEGRALLEFATSRTRQLGSFDAVNNRSLRVEDRG